MEGLALPPKHLPGVGWYSWYEWCYLFHPTGRLVIKTHAKPNLGQSFKLKIYSPSQVSTLFTHWLSLLLPTLKYSYQESCLGRWNFLIASGEPLLLHRLLTTHHRLFLSSHSLLLVQVAFRSHTLLNPFPWSPSLMPPEYHSGFSSFTFLIQTMTHLMSIQAGTSYMSVIKGAKSYTFLSELICNKKTRTRKLSSPWKCSEVPFRIPTNVSTYMKDK